MCLQPAISENQQEFLPNSLEKQHKRLVEAPEIHTYFLDNNTFRYKTEAWHYNCKEHIAVCLFFVRCLILVDGMGIGSCRRLPITG